METVHLKTILNWPMPLGSRLLPYKKREAATHTLRLSVRRAASAVGPSFRGKSSCKSRYPSAGDMHASMGHIQMSSPPSNYSKQVQTNRRNETRVLRLHGNSV